MSSAGVILERTNGRSRITNGSVLLPGVDGRSTWSRRLRDLIALHVADLGGPEAISEAERSIVRRAAALTVELENFERKFALAGEATIEQLDAYQRAANSMRRLLESVGLQRRARDVTPDLRTYMAARAKPVVDAEAETVSESKAEAECEASEQDGGNG